MSAQQFLQENIDENARVKPLDMKGILSPAMNSRYAFWQLDLLGKTYLLANPSDQFTVKGLARHFEEIEVRTDNPVILYTETLSPYSKRKLISERIPFLLFDKQFFLPMLALNINAKSDAVFAKRDILTPAAHAVFLYLLYAESSKVTQQELQEKLSLSAISVSRVVKELRSLDLIEVQPGGKTNRKRDVWAPDKRELYHNGMKYFGRAVKQTICCKGEPKRKLLLSGLSALSKRSMINPPKRESFVLYSRTLKSLDLCQISEEEFFDSAGAYSVDLLNYDPTHLAFDGIADPVTMMLTLHERDERIDTELNNYMKGFEWYTD
jgi:DNA-binding MarR family transcriptional regulator